MNQKYLIRLDDACPTMDKTKWNRMEGILDRYGIKPMVGIVPDCKDEKLFYQEPDNTFWENARTWHKKSWTIALHGYNHSYVSDRGMEGLNPMWMRSEFAGVPLDEQKEKIRKGVAIMRENGINPKYFFAPSHTFDKNTLIALREESDIMCISDTIGRYPYERDGFWFIPQIIGHCVKMPFDGIYTFCFHPSTMNGAAFVNIENFIKEYCRQFIGFNEIDLSKYDVKKAADKLLSFCFFKIRKIRGLK